MREREREEVEELRKSSFGLEELEEDEDEVEEEAAVLERSWRGMIVGRAFSREESAELRLLVVGNCTYSEGGEVIERGEETSEEGGEEAVDWCSEGSERVVWFSLLCS